MEVFTPKVSTGDLMILSAVCFLLPCIIQAKSKFKRLHITCGWFGRAMVLGSFQCRGPTAMAHSRARACCACSRCGIGGLLFFFFFFLCAFCLSCRISYLSFSNASSLVRQLDMTEILGLYIQMLPDNNLL